MNKDGQMPGSLELWEHKEYMSNKTILPDRVNDQWEGLYAMREADFLPTWKLPQLCTFSGVELEIYQVEVTDDNVVDDDIQIPAGRDYDWVA